MPKFLTVLKPMKKSMIFNIQTISILNKKVAWLIKKSEGNDLLAKARALECFEKLIISV